MNIALLGYLRRAGLLHDSADLERLSNPTAYIDSINLSHGAVAKSLKNLKNRILCGPDKRSIEYDDAYAPCRLEYADLMIGIFV